jgi:threonine synthase
MRSSSVPFDLAVDTRHDASRSVVLRYLNAFRLAEANGQEREVRDLLARCSIAEGVRLFPLLTYEGVDLHVLDETSGMHTGTLKSIDGCVTIAACLSQGLRRVVFESGGNTGVALTAYGRRVGIETFCIVPEENLPLLDGRPFAGDGAHLIAVHDPGLVRPAAERLAAHYPLARIPRVGWRIAASRFLGCFLLEQLLGGAEFSHLVQTISAGFGPIGIYDVLAEQGVPLPSFVGVQQAENCAMFRAWRARSADVPATPVRSTAALLSPVMYDSEPQTYGTLERLTSLLERTGGHLTTIAHDEFDAALDQHPAGRDVLRLLAERGVEIGRRDGTIIERTGLIAIAGALKEIDAGAIPRGSRVVCLLTSGAGTPDGRAIPELRVRDLAVLVRAAGERWFQEPGHA